MLQIALVLTAALVGATWAQAETIDVKNYGKLDLAPFACTDVSRSSFINRACYDKAKRFMVVQLKTVYHPYWEMPAPTYDAFLAAPSLGKYYNANIKGTGQDGPFDCRTHPIRLKAYERQQSDELDKQLDIEAYLDFIDKKKIIEKQENWDVFKKYFNIPLPGEKGQAKNLRWMDRLNELRRVVAHSHKRAFKS